MEKRNFMGTEIRENLNNVAKKGSRRKGFSPRHKAERLMSFCRFGQIRAVDHRYPPYHRYDLDKEFRFYRTPRNAKARIKQIPILFIKTAVSRATLVSAFYHR